MKQSSVSRLSRTASPAKSSPNRRDVILKKREEQWIITPTQGIPQYSADKDPNCPKAVVRTYNRVKRENAIHRAAKGKGASEWIEKTMRKKFEDIPVRETPSLREKASIVALETESVGEVEILQKIIVRENLLNELRTLLKYQTDIDSVASEIAEFVRAIRHQSLTIVEDVHGWKCSQTVARQFLYRGENYLLKMMEDAAFLDQFEEIYEIFGFYFTGNPLMYSGRTLHDNSMTSDAKPLNTKLAPLDLYRDERFVDGINERRLRFAEEVIEREVRAYESQTELIVGERGMNESSVLNDKSNPVSRRNSMMLSSRKNSGRDMSSTLPNPSVESQQHSSVMSRSLSDIPYSGAPYKPATSQITVPNKRLEKLSQLKEELEEMRAMRAHIEEQVMFNVNEHKKMGQKVKHLELKRQDAINLRRDAYAQHTAVEISIVQVNMKDTNMTIKNLQRQAYFLEQEMKRKKVLISAVKKEIAEEKRSKKMKSALLQKVKQNGLISVLIDVNKSTDIGKQENDEVSLPDDDISYSVHPSAEETNSLSLIETSEHEVVQEEDDDVLVPEVKEKSNKVLSMLDTMPELKENTGSRNHGTDKSVRPAVMFRGDNENIEVAIHRPQGYSDTGKFSPPKSLVAYREAVKECIAEVEHLAYFISDSAVNSVLGQLRVFQESKISMKFVESDEPRAISMTSESPVNIEHHQHEEEPLLQRDFKDDDKSVDLVSSTLAESSTLDEILSAPLRNISGKEVPELSRADSIIQEILQGASRHASHDLPEISQVSVLDDACASNAVAEEVGAEESIDLEESLVSDDDGMYDSSIVIEDEEDGAENSDVATQTDVLDQIDMLSMTGGVSVDMNSTEKKSKKKRRKRKKADDEIAVGSKVETKGKGKNNWNRGSVLRIRPNNTVDILLDDGTKVFSVTQDFVRSLPIPKVTRKRRPIKAGSSVEIYQDKKWLSATVTKVRANQSFVVDVAEGERGLTVTKDHIRLIKKKISKKKIPKVSSSRVTTHPLHAKVEVQLSKSIARFAGEIIGIAPRGTTYTVKLETGEKVAGIASDRIRLVDVESSMDELSQNEAANAPDAEYEDIGSSFDSLSRAEKHLALSLMRHEIHNVADRYAKDITTSAVAMVSMTQRYGSDYSTEPESFSEMSIRASSPGRVFRGVVRPAGGGYALVKAKKSGTHSFDLEVLNVDSEVQVTHSRVGTARTPRVIDEVVQEAASSMGGLERVLQGEKQGLIYQLGVTIHGEYRLLQLRRLKKALHLTSYRIDGARMKTVHLSAEDVADTRDYHGTSAYLQQLLESYEIGVIAQHILVVHAKRRVVSLCRNRKGLYITVHDHVGQLIWMLPLGEEETEEIYNSYNLPKSLKCIVDRSNSGTLHRMGVVLWEKSYLLKLHRDEEELSMVCLRLSDGKVESMPLDEDCQINLEKDANYAPAMYDMFRHSQTGLVYRCSVMMFGKEYTASVMRSDSATEVLVVNGANPAKKYEFKLSSAEVTLLETSKAITAELTVKCLEKFRGTISRLSAVVLGTLYLTRVYKASTGVWLAAYDTMQDTKRTIRLSPDQEREILTTKATRSMMQRIVLNGDRDGIIAKTAVLISGISHLAQLVGDEDGLTFTVVLLRVRDSKMYRYTTDDEKLLFCHDVHVALREWCCRMCSIIILRSGISVYNKLYLTTLTSTPAGMILRATSALFSMNYCIQLSQEQTRALLEAPDLRDSVIYLLQSSIAAPLPALPLTTLSANVFEVAKVSMILYGVSYLMRCGKDCDGFYISALRLCDDQLCIYRPTCEDEILFAADIPAALRDWCSDNIVVTRRFGVAINGCYYMLGLLKKDNDVRICALNVVTQIKRCFTLSATDVHILQSSSDIASDAALLLRQHLESQLPRQTSFAKAAVRICGRAYLVSRGVNESGDFVSLLRLCDNRLLFYRSNAEDSLHSCMLGLVLRCGVFVVDKYYFVELVNNTDGMDLITHHPVSGVMRSWRLSPHDADACWNCPGDISETISSILTKSLSIIEPRCGILVNDQAYLLKMDSETREIYHVSSDKRAYVVNETNSHSPRRVVELHAAKIE